MYVRVCACVGQTLLSYARGFPRGPKAYRQATAVAALGEPGLSLSHSATASARQSHK